DAYELVDAEVAQQHDGVEAREELRAHAVVEEVLVAQPVAQREAQLLVDLAGLEGGGGAELAAVAADGDAVVDGVPQPLESAGANEQQTAAVDGDRAAARPVGQPQRDRLVLDQRQERLL